MAWLGKIPSEWEPLRLRFALVTNPSNREIKLESDALVSFVPMDAVGEYGGIRLDTDKELSEIGSGYTYFSENDVVVAKITPCFENGKGAIAKGLTNKVAFGTTELHVLRPKENLFSNFLFYLTISYIFRNLGESEMFGAGGQKRVPDRFIKDFRVALPSWGEQQTIARFLDYKTAQIDALIAKKELLLKKLAQKRTALISHAVTKGLDPSVPMKDSGVPWLGEIPVHWQVKRLRFLLRGRFTNGLFKKAEFWGDGNRIINITDLYIHNDLVDEEKLDRLECNEDELQAYSANHGDFFVVRSSLKLEGIGKSAVLLYPSESTVFECHIVRGRPNLNDVHPRFLNLFMNSSYSRQHLMTRSNIVTMATIDQEKIKNLFVPLPEYDEQQQIAEFIDMQAARIDLMVATAGLAIAKFKEYRTSLITHAVTGKIDVRNVPIPEQDETEAA